ncbi:MAG TPA: intradiol ring-cleavage dioxygenase [Gemmatimonadaceae bacterium]|jgi:protocatechuate 3,4-dioxygenase beta subunit|nr:intradiol ring-cleavage dioxygenase [Gemmatimonadaceae bacterium]
MAGKLSTFVPKLTQLSRRDLLGFAAKGAASVFVSQSLLASCAAAGTNVTDTTSSGGTGASAPTTGSSSCVLTASLTEGPFFVDEKLNRSDIRTDPASGVVSAGIPLALTFNVQRVASNACTPLTGAYLDVWHCDAAGVYSDVSGSSRKFLRGYQITDANGVAAFQTVYPGWYNGRAVHIHFKLRLYAGSTKTYEFTSQFFFDDTFTDSVYTQSPYSSRGSRGTRNGSDGIYNSLSTTDKSGLTLQTSKTSDGYAGVINLGVNVA